MDKRYQIFISSTFADLKEEREKVMRAILELKCFPAGMELFKAGSKPKFSQISSVIDECDFYILIIGARYGSMDKDGVSWTEKEYNYAIERGIPVLAFVHGDIQNIPLQKAEVKTALRRKLEAFRSRVEDTSIVSYWKNADELKSNVLSSLYDALEQEKRENKRIGWVRADRVVCDDSQKDIERLTNEIADSQNQVKKLKADIARKDKDCESLLEKSKEEAQQEIKSAQAIIEQLQDELNTQKKRSDEDRQSFQEKVNHAASGLEKILDELKGNRTETIYIPGTDVAFKMVYIEGGTFMMGANDGDKSADSDEKPAHKVTLSDYYIGETEVTQALWLAVMGKNPSFFDDDLNLPVEQVSWNDCLQFIKKLNRLTGKSFHLPTEAQWEFAARGGNKSKGYIYAGGNDISMVAWNEANSESKTHVVAKKTANELGLYDMSGNVWEWCQDRFVPYSTGADGQAFFEKTSSDSNRVRRGGSYVNGIRGCRVSFRDCCDLNYESSNLGLRLVL